MCFISHNAVKMQVLLSFYSLFLSLFLMNEPNKASSSSSSALFVSVCLRLLKPAGVMQGVFQLTLKKT